MNHKMLKSIALIALKNIDKRATSQLAATVATKVAERDGNRAVGVIAKLVSQGLSATGQQPTQIAPNHLAPSDEGDPQAGHSPHSSSATDANSQATSNPDVTSTQTPTTPTHDPAVSAAMAQSHQAEANAWASRVYRSW
jgi:hypothetical protein